MLTSGLPKHMTDLFGHSNLLVTFGKRHRNFEKYLRHAVLADSNSRLCDHPWRDDSDTTFPMGRIWQFRHGINRNPWRSLRCEYFFVTVFGFVNEDLFQELGNDLTTWFAGIGTLIPYQIPGSTLAKAHAARSRVIRIIQKLMQDYRNGKLPKGANTKLLDRLLSWYRWRWQSSQWRWLGRNCLHVIVCWIRYNPSQFWNFFLPIVPKPRHYGSRYLRNPNQVYSRSSGIWRPQEVTNIECLSGWNLANQTTDSSWTQTNNGRSTLQGLCYPPTDAYCLFHHARVK